MRILKGGLAGHGPMGVLARSPDFPSHARQQVDTSSKRMWLLRFVAIVLFLKLVSAPLRSRLGNSFSIPLSETPETEIRGAL